MTRFRNALREIYFGREIHTKTGPINPADSSPRKLEEARLVINT
jgi:hypothetical protein